MRIGLAISFFDFRNDVRRLISALQADNNEVVVFCLPRDAQTVRGKIDERTELRLIREDHSSFNNRLQKKLHLIGKQIPQSRQNFYLMERFKAQLNKSCAKRLYARLMLELCYRTPEFYSYDSYLDKLQYSRKTQLDDIETLVFFTEIIDDGLLARAIREHRNPLVYVYSWDHPCKHTRFSKRVEYLVWSRGLKDDLQALQGIDAHRIHTIGASQFCYIEQYRACQPKPVRRFHFPYVYFGCAIGVPELVGEEVARIKHLARMMDEVRSPLKLVVRPYPVLNDWGYYRSLEGMERIVVDDSYRTADLSVADAALMDKFATVEYAEAFVHMGTTLGYEACFVDTPSFIIDYGYPPKNGALSLRNFVHQYQNEKYLMPEGFVNVIRSDAQLRERLRDLADGTTGFLEYNHLVTSDVPLKSFAQLAADLVSIAKTVGRSP